MVPDPSNPNAAPSWQEQVPPPAGAPPRIVAIDDDPMILLMIARTLGAEGITCHTAISGADGLRLIREHQPDLVLLDIVMVGEDGFSVCREIRRTWSPEEMPVVMVTTLEDLPSIQAAYSAGANDFLTKPLHWKHLPFRIRHVLEASRAFKAVRESEERYHRITSAITDYIYTVRLVPGAAAQTTHGPGCCAVTGYRPEDFAQDPFLWIRMVVDEDRPAVMEQVRRILAGEDPPPIEHRIQHPGGGERWVRNTFVPHRDVRGTLVAYDGLVQDITEHKRAEDALRASEAKFSKIFHLSPDAIDLTHLESGVSVEVNPSYEKMYGYSREEIIGHSTLPGDLGIWMRAEDRERHVAELKAHSVALGFEAPMRRKDGTTVIALISSAILETKGERYNLTLAHNITERKRVEEALRESSQRLELAALSGSLGIWDWNLQDQSVVWNDRMYEMYGLDRRDHRPSFESWTRRLVHPEDQAKVRENMRAAIEDGKPYRIAFRVILPGGEIRHIASNGMVIRDASGQPVRVLGVNRDRTEQVQAEFERRRLQEERQHSEKLESLGSLAGGMAHDMNNVLAAIMGMASALRAACPDLDPRARPLDSILHASGRGRDLVKALTDFARKGLEEPHWFDLNQLLRKEADLLGHAGLRQIQLLLDLDPALPEVLGDASALGGAIMNLGINALDAMPDGGTLSFRSLALPGGRIQLEVSDSGHGMAPEILARAMEPFFTTKPVGQGTGLGLARVYGTVKAHGGTLELQSEPGRGTTVRILLPAIPGQPKGAGAESAPEAKARDAQQALSVLLVDDDELIQGSTHALLDVLGHRTVAVYSGEEALAQLEAGLEPDVVLLDLNMPGLGGAGTLPRLRQLRPDLPVLLATGRADQTALDLVRNYPKVALMSKPFSMRELRQQLAALGRDWEGAAR